MPTEKEYMLEEATAAVTYQPKLTAGRNITIDNNNVISSSGQGGSVVTVTPNQTSGNLIATVTVDSNSYNLYSPLPQVMTGATSEVRGEQGLVPAPSIGYQDYVLYGDGTWKNPEIPSIIANPSTSAIRDLTKISIDGIVYDVSSGGGGSEVVECTQDEYDALPSSKLTDNKIYCISGTKVLDPNYEYHEYIDGQNGKIVVRIHENMTEWFFMEWHQTATAISFPTELEPYKPSNTDPILGANYPDGGTTQDGWIGFYDNSIRAWSQSTEDNVTGIKYGVVNINGESRQYIPYEDPYIWVSSSIKKIVVNGTEYGNTGDGGGGSATEITTLLDVQSATSPMNLSDDLFNYDTIFLEIKDSNGYARGISYASSILDIGQNIGFDNTYGYTWNEITSGTVLTNISRNNFYISSIVGIKSSSGGGGGTEVIPNPSGVATEGLTKLEIDGTIYSIDGGVPIEEEDIDPNDFVNNYQSSMNISVDSTTNKLTYQWNSGTQIGTCSVLNYPIDLSIYTGAKVKITTGATAYSTTEFYGINVGVRSGYSTNYLGTTSTGWILQETFYDLNSTITYAFDFSTLTGTDNYFYICGGGWNFVVDEIVFYKKGESTKVIPNPPDQPTDTLDSIKIDDTVYAIAGGSGTEKVTDIMLPQNSWYLKNEYSMNVAWSNNEIVFTWDGGINIGASAQKSIVIPAEIDKIRFKITTGTSYYSTYSALERFKVAVGLRATYDTSWVYPDPTYTSDWLALTSFATPNDVWEGELDTSSINVDTYLYIMGHGWNMTINEVKTVKIEKNIEPNPEEIPTEILHTLGINSTVYSIPGALQPITLTAAQYAALPSTQKMDSSKIYFVTDE